MNKMQNILVVDDDRGIRDLLGKFLRQHGFQISLARDGREMKIHLQNTTFDLVILDIMMPGEDGLSLCRQLRAESQIPIIMLTAVSEEVERILGLEMGADDYLGKPFNPRELLARVRAILRRAGHGLNGEEHPVKSLHIIYRFDNWELDQTTRRLISPESLEVTLSSGEFDLLLALLRAPQQVLSRDTLLDLTKNRLATPFDRSIDIQISRLRHKIEKDHGKPSIIKTVRGGGYVLAVPVTRKTVE
jgi:two-component system OmpR family response regulator